MLFLTFLLLCFGCQYAFAQTDTLSQNPDIQTLKSELAALRADIQTLKSQTIPKQDSNSATKPKYHISGVGAMNYYNFDWQTDTVKRNGIDNERFVLELEYQWTPKIGLEAELEFEHGGTGTAVEFDRFEEFGEFEFDISKGGEILIEQMHLNFNLHKRIELQLGRVKVPFGRMFARSEPTQYLTAISSEMENYILPENWTENGLSFKLSLGKNNQWKIYGAVVNGLDCSAFNSANWIKRGNQARFELANAENFAFAARIDYQPHPEISFGLSYYGGNTADNRPKPDLRVNAILSLAEAHILYKNDWLNASGMFMYGTLSNSEQVSDRNRNLSNNLNVKRTPVGAAALGAFAELGFILMNAQGTVFTHPQHQLIVYGRYDYYDTQFKTQGQIFNNPRWERQTWSAGLVFKVLKNVQLKAQYSLRKVGAPAPTSVNGGVLEQTIVAGFCFGF